MPTSDQPDAGLWLSPAVLSLPLNPLGRLILAILCQQAANQSGQCQQPSDDEIADRLLIYAPSVSGLIQQLEQNRYLTVVSESTLRLLRPSAELLADYLPRVCTGSTAPSLPVMVCADPAVRMCPVTGVDVSHQRENVPLASRTTLRKLASAHYPTFQALYDRFLPTAGSSPSINKQSANLASHIRQRWSAHRSGLL